MPAYHSGIKIGNVVQIKSFPLLPLRTTIRGPAPRLPPLGKDDLDASPENKSYDCVDEILLLFRANVLFRNFEIKSPADRVLIYGTLFVSECLGMIDPLFSSKEAKSALENLARKSFAIPGDVTFPLNQIFASPDEKDVEDYRMYIGQLRQEIATRLHAMLYANGEEPSKYWLCFAKRKFMGKSL